MSSGKSRKKVFHLLSRDSQAPFTARSVNQITLLCGFAGRLHFYVAIFILHNVEKVQMLPTE